ncbi:MAG: hypothetical protein MJ135_04090 [Oscillospiraceae bacterium]|nr:hypothetical protein [Oscillospiraceae bacterium]
MYSQAQKTEAQRLVNECSKIEEEPMTIGGKKVTSFIVEIPADDFLPAARNPWKLSRLVRAYGDCLWQETEHLRQQRDMVLMSPKHIREETMAHLIPWFLYARRAGKGRLWLSCKEVNLNADENRRVVKLLMFAGRVMLALFR